MLYSQFSFGFGHSADCYNLKYCFNKVNCSCADCWVRLFLLLIASIFRFLSHLTQQLIMPNSTVQVLIMMVVFPPLLLLELLQSTMGTSQFFLHRLLSLRKRFAEIKIKHLAYILVELCYDIYYLLNDHIAFPSLVTNQFEVCKLYYILKFCTL